MLLYHRLFAVVLIVFLNGLISGNNSLLASQNIGIIPAPKSVSINTGYFIFNENTKIAYSHSSIMDIAIALKEFLIKDIGTNIQLLKCRQIANSKSTIELKLQKGFGSEGYQIVINSETVSCRASTKTGLYYAIQSVRQLIQTENGNSKVQCMQIDDAPRFAWRGFMLDEARQFFGKKTVMLYLDIMAKIKMNRFHWHLSDEQAFRLGINRFPLFATISSVGSWSNRNAPAAFYTQNDIKEIVAYAAERHIMIIPEIDMPGHATAITRAYPYLSGGGSGRWTGFTLNPARESTYKFIDSLMTDIANLFPSPYIHIGADEVHFGNQSWHTDAEIQKFISVNGLIDELGLEHYFIKRVSDIIHKKRKQIIAWDEIVNVDLNKNRAAVMWWRHDKPELLKQALHLGYNVIMTPRRPCYFDYVQDDDHQIGRRKFWDTPNINTLKIVYDFPDLPQEYADIVNANQKHILGLQASLWSERIGDQKRLDFLTFPRLIAMAEAGWTKKESKSYPDFMKRLKLFLPQLANSGIYYFNIFDKQLTPEPWGPIKEDIISDETPNLMQ